MLLVSIGTENILQKYDFVLVRCNADETFYALITDIEQSKEKKISYKTN